MNRITAIHARLTELLAAGRVDDACRFVVRCVDEALDAGMLADAALLARRSSGPLVEAGRWSVALAVIDAVLECDPDGADPVRRGRLLAARAGILRVPRRSREALEAQTEAIALLDGRVPGPAMTTLRHDRAVLLAELGLVEDAVVALVAAREAFLGLRDRVGVAACDHNLGFVLHDLGAWDDAIEYLTEARDIFVAVDMAEEAAACDQNLGVVFFDCGRLRDAGRRFAVAHHRFEACGAKVSAAECDANLATLLTAMGQADEAMRYRNRAESAGVGMPTAPGTSAQVAAVAEERPAPSAQSVRTSRSDSA